MENENIDSDEYAALGMDAISEINNMSSVSNRSAMSTNRKMITSRFKMFQTVVLGKAKKCNNAKKVADILLYVNDLEENVGAAANDIKNGSYISPTISKKIAVEYLKTNKYERDNEKVDRDVLNLILSIMNDLSRQMDNHANDLETVSKLEQLRKNIDKEIFNFFDFLQI